MTKEQIEKAVDEYIGYSPEMDEGIETTMRRNAFKDGANWRINSVWHKPYDVPEIGKDCLVEYRTGNGDVRIRIDCRSEYEWIEACHYDRILHWAYIDDLIPTEDETA